MNLSKKIKHLERKGIISKKPHPIVPFILGFVILIIGIAVRDIGIDKIWSSSLLFLAGFTFLFAVLHLIVVRILES